MIELNKIYCEDCLETLKRIPDNFVDSIITDPPYGIGFMGKEWDNFKPSFIEKKTADHLPIDHKLQSGRSASMHAGLYDLSITGLKKYQAWCYDWAKECLRVLKPGGHLLAFGGTRTYHRMACAIENAGFEIRDQIQWIYGSGFPKSLDISKAIDKMNGESGRLLKFVKWMRTTGLKQKEINEIIDKSDVGSHYLRLDQPAIPTAELWAKLRSHIKIEIPTWIDDLVERIEAERKIIGKNKTNLTVYQNIGRNNISGDIDITIPKTPEAQQWEGWGTALKPANEPICMARKPLSEKTVAENVLKWGTGGINIDECRIVTNDKLNGGATTGSVSASEGWDRPWRHNEEYIKAKSNRAKKQVVKGELLGRWPANVIHDGSEEVLREFSNTTSGNLRKGQVKAISLFNGGNYESMERDGDSGSAARFFYCAKASKAERNAGCEGMELKDPVYGKNMSSSDKGTISGSKLPNRNNHPTVKPIALMRYLCRLVTPPKGIVYDPFAGSGTTGIAAGLEDFNFIGSEISPEYVRIAEKRVAFHKAQLKLQYE